MVHVGSKPGGVVVSCGRIWKLQLKKGARRRVVARTRRCWSRECAQEGRVEDAVGENNSRKKGKGRRRMRSQPQRNMTVLVLCLCLAGEGAGREEKSDAERGKGVSQRLECVSCWKFSRVVVLGPLGGSVLGRTARLVRSRVLMGPRSPYFSCCLIVSSLSNYSAGRLSSVVRSTYAVVLGRPCRIVLFSPYFGLPDVCWCLLACLLISFCLWPAPFSVVRLVSLVFRGPIVSTWIPSLPGRRQLTTRVSRAERRCLRGPRGGHEECGLLFMPELLTAVRTVRSTGRGPWRGKARPLGRTKVRFGGNAQGTFHAYERCRR
jgi:hypothetical protein